MDAILCWYIASTFIPLSLYVWLAIDQHNIESSCWATQYCIIIVICLDTINIWYTIYYSRLRYHQDTFVLGMNEYPSNEYQQLVCQCIYFLWISLIIILLLIYLSLEAINVYITPLLLQAQLPYAEFYSPHFIFTNLTKTIRD